MDDTKLNVNILTDLDSILDTKLPLVYAIYPKIIPTILEDDKYRNRCKDVFGSMSYDIFKTYYRKRTKSILKLATPTPMLDMLKEYVIETHTPFNLANLKHAPIVYINIYPYDLDLSEKQILVSMLTSLLPEPTNIRLINYSNKELTTKFVSTNVATIIKYDMLEWLELQSSIGELTKYPLKDIMCIAPMIANGNTPASKITQNDFDKIIGAFAPLASLVFIKTSYFSKK